MSVAAPAAETGRGIGPTRVLVLLASAGGALYGVLVGALSAEAAGAAIAAVALVVVTTVAGAWITLYVAAFPLQGVSLFGVQAFGLRLSHVFFLTALAAAALTGLVRGRESALRLRPLDVLVVAFVALKVGSVAWSQAPLARSGVAAAKMLLDLVVYFTLAALVRSDAVGTIRRVAVGFAIAFLMMTALTLYNLGQLGFQGLVVRLVLESATTGAGAIDQLSQGTSAFTGEANRNIIAAWEVLGLMIGWGLLAGRWRGLRRLERLFWLAAIAAAACYIVLSLSRTTWLSLVAGGVVLWWCAGRRVSRRAVAWLCVTGGVLLGALLASGFLPVLLGRIRAVSSAQDYGVSSRFEVWRAGFAQFLRHPLLGVGIEGTEALTREMTTGGVAGNLHNVYMQALAELGLVGVCVFGGMLAAVLWSLGRAGRRLPPSLRRLAWGLFAAVCCYLVQGLTQYDFMDLGIWTVLGLSAGMVRVAEAEESLAHAQAPA